MATNNTEARKKQKITEAVDNGGNSLLLTTPAVVVPALSFGSILKEFPDFLFCVLPCIADRVVWNSIASSNKDMLEKSKAIQPPWPLYYRFPRPNCFAWSPCGTCIAYEVLNFNIAIVDQRHGPFRNNGNDNNYLDWVAHDDYCITDLKFSPDGSYLVSAGEDGFIKLWDNVTGNYEQLQEWNMREEFADELADYLNPNFSISACSKYIAVSMGTGAYLKDVEGKTIKSLTPNENMMHIDNIMFSSKDCAIFICCQQHKTVFIKVWRPYLDDDDEDRLITLTSKPNSGMTTYNMYKFSNDNTMVVIHNVMTNTGVLWSVDTDNKCLTKKFDVQGRAGLHFTPDGKFIVVNKENGPTL